MINGDADQRHKTTEEDLMYTTSDSDNGQQPKREPDTALGADLAALFAGEDERLAQSIRSHTLDGVEQRLRRRSVMGTLGDLLAVGPMTIQLLLNNDGSTADSTDEGH